MFSSLRGFLNRHKKKFLVTSVVIGGTALALNYGQRKLREWQEREARNFLDMTRKKQHFESTERTCTHTILSLAPSVCEAVTKALDTQEILNQLRSNPANKVQLWEELKVLTFARVTSMVYAFTILVVTLRIQLNIVGGYLYKDSTNTNSQSLISNDLQQKYLSLCHYFVSEGVEKLCRQIENKVRSVVQSIPLKQKLSLKETEQVFWSIQTAMCIDNADPLKQMALYLIEEKNTDEDLLKKLLNETLDLLESEEVGTLSTSSVSRGLALLVDQIAEFFGPNTPPNGKVSIVELNSQQGTSNESASKSQLNFVNVNNIELPLAKLIPIINGLVSQPLGRGLSGVPDIAMQQLILNDKLKVLGANIYESFSC